MTNLSLNSVISVRTRNAHDSILTVVQDWRPQQRPPEITNRLFRIDHFMLVGSREADNSAINI